jgi:hypothetical protein
MEEGHLVHMPGQVRKEIADPSAALSMRAHSNGDFISGPTESGEEAGLVVEPGEFLAVALRISSGL